MLGHLRQLGHVLPLTNQIVRFFIDEEPRAVEIRLRDEQQSLLKVESLIENLLRV